MKRFRTLRSLRSPCSLYRFAAVIAAFAVLAETSPAEEFRLAEDDVVVFLGGTNMLRMQQAGYLEAQIARSFPNVRAKYRDLAWEGDTVFRQGTVIDRWRKQAHFGDLKGLGSLADQLDRLNANVVIVQFGQTESLADSAGVDPFVNAYNDLLDAITADGRRIALISPIAFEAPADPLIPDLSRRNEDLAHYVAAIEKIAEQRKLIFVDLFKHSQGRLTNNGMHVRDDAQPRLAREIAKQLEITAVEDEALEPLRRAIVEKHRLWYDYWRPANWKLLYGDDARRQFTRGQVSFREEWQQLVPLIESADKRIWRIAAGKNDPGPERPRPETLHGDESADIEAELAAFTVADGMQVNLFASEEHGLTSPLAIRWDPAGRMYVTVTTTYPHVRPGDLPNDKIIVLEDGNADGRADHSTVFAEGLNIPTGLEWGDGGVYVGQNTELLFLKDTSGDGKADTRRVVLSGFGNGDSHQTINSFVWSPGGELYFGQGDGCESRVETPWGVSSLYQAGFFRLRPRRLQLHPLLDDFMGPGNPWGVAFDRWGQIFSIDGAGGVTFLSPGQVPVSHRRRLRTIGQPGGYCGIGYLEGRSLPAEMQGDFAVGDFKANRVKRFTVESEGAGYKLYWKQPLLHSRHRNFRPVDVKMGPDGAIYIVDWYNPITCHQDDAFRDPRRDKAHGRIWRVSSKGSEDRVDVRPGDLSKAPIEDVINALASPEQFTRYQAKREMTRRDPATVAKALHAWVRSLEPQAEDYEHHLYEALGAYATIEVVEPKLLGRVLHSKDHRARAYAARLVGRWHDRLDAPLMLLEKRVADEHPQVRMEAIIACAAVPAPQAVAVAALAVDHPRDEWINYAFGQTVQHLKPHWLPGLEQGHVSFSNSNQLSEVLSTGGGREVIDRLRKLADSNGLDGTQRFKAISFLIATGDWNDWKQYGLNRQHYRQQDRYDPDAHGHMLDFMAEQARLRDIRPADEAAELLRPLMQSNQPRLHAGALQLAGIWKIKAFEEHVTAVAKDETTIPLVRKAAFGAMIDMNLSTAPDLLSQYARESRDLEIQAVAVQALATSDSATASRLALEVFTNPKVKDEAVTETLRVLVEREGGSGALSAAFREAELNPAQAKRVIVALYSLGRADQELLSALQGSTETPDYSSELVTHLVNRAAEQGDARRGAAVYKNMACAACHKVGGQGGAVGPDLSAIGTTLSADRIVEELLWPSRQIKEGFSTVEVVTVDGKIRQGFTRPGGEDQLLLQNLATRDTISIPRDKIEQQRTLPSAMPTGLTSVLSESQTLDLIHYLTKLGTLE